MAKYSFKSWVQDFRIAKEDLRRAQKKVSELEPVACLMKDARSDILDELRVRLQKEYDEAQSRQREGYRLSGLMRGIALSIEVLDELKNEVHDYS